MRSVVDNIEPAKAAITRRLASFVRRAVLALPICVADLGASHYARIFCLIIAVKI